MNDDVSRCSDWMPDLGNLDEAWAWRTLDGLGHEGAISMLAVNPSTLTEALYYANGRCFVYYLGVLLDYLLSETARSNFAAAAGFMDLLITKRPPPDMCVGVRRVTLLEGVRFVASKQEFYEADEDLFGSFSELSRQYAGG